ncbi:MAG: permease [Cytophagales bacterium]|nr:permease [Cytophagales bacterium]
MEKTVGLLLMIGLGLALQRKISSSEQLKGLKVLILSVALPATIFVALLNVKLSENMLIFPLMALVINGILLAITYVGKPLFSGLQDARHRTLMMLLPSFAPGLSCFPFIAEYLGDESLALAALADVGNKVFVLILLYLLAMHWYHRANQDTSSKSSVKQVLVALIGEPINLVMVVALVMLGFGFNLQSLPIAVSEVILRMSGIMAPLILLFIGLAVKITKNDLALVLKALMLRSGILLVLSAMLLFVITGLSLPTMLLIVVFPQSSCSFWPFAHMSAVSALEKGENQTFDINFALSTLAISLPFSTVVVLGTFTFQSWSVNPVFIAISGTLFITIASFGFLKKWTQRTIRIVFKGKYVTHPVSDV